jgi:hypothetical protein
MSFGCLLDFEVLHERRVVGDYRRFVADNRVRARFYLDGGWTGLDAGGLRQV